MYNTIIIGLGCVGTSTICELSKETSNILGIEKFDTLNEKGSSHGDSRIMRLAYHEGEKYVPLLKESIKKWKELEKEADEKLFHQTGTLTIGKENSKKYIKSKETCDSMGIEYRNYTGSKASDIFDGWDLPDYYNVMFQPDGGLINNKKCMASQLEKAKDNGAEIHKFEEVICWEKKNNIITVRTNKDTYQTENLVITSGPWAKNINNRISNLLDIERHISVKIRTEKPLYKENQFPPWILDTGDRKFYGMSNYNKDEIKLGETTEKEIISDMSKFNREVIEKEKEECISFCKEFLDSKIKEEISSISCPLTHTPDGDFIIDEIDNSRIFIGVGLSGHGFKLSNVIGEILAKLVLEENISYDIDHFSLDRFKT